MRIFEVMTSAENIHVFSICFFFDSWKHKKIGPGKPGGAGLLPQKPNLSTENQCLEGDPFLLKWPIFRGLLFILGGVFLVQGTMRSSTKVDSGSAS